MKKKTKKNGASGNKSYLIGDQDNAQKRNQKGTFSHFGDISGNYTHGYQDFYSDVASVSEDEMFDDGITGDRVDDVDLDETYTDNRVRPDKYPQDGPRSKKAA